MAKQGKEIKEVQEEQITSNSDESSSGNNCNCTDGASAENADCKNAAGNCDDSHVNSMTSEIDAKDELIMSLQAKVEELNDKFLRLFSEFDNARKRYNKEKADLIKTASSDIIEAVLPVMDDLERAHINQIENPDSDALLNGINLIRLKMKTTLKHRGLEEIPSVGEVFNTDLHEAITHVPAKDKNDKGKIIEELQKGYMLNGKVIRFAKVVVAN